MGQISKFNAVQFENCDKNSLVGVTLVYRSTRRDGTITETAVNFAGDEYAPNSR